MPHTLVQHSLGSISGLAKDAVVNTWHFDSAAPVTQVQGEALAAIVIDFYTTLPAGSDQGVKDYLAATSLGSPKHTAKVYNMADLQPRVPIATVTDIGVSGAAAGPLPAEVAVCLSFRGSITSGAVAARRRGRIYIGPLNSNSGVAVAGFLRPTNALMSAMLMQADALAIAAEAAGHTWSVYSPTTAATLIEDGGDFPLTQIVSISVDNAFDTMRSRGPAPTTKFQQDVPAT